MSNSSNNKIYRITSTNSGFKYTPYISDPTNSIDLPPDPYPYHANILPYHNIPYKDMGNIFIKKKHNYSNIAINPLEWAKRNDRYYHDGKYTVIDPYDNVVDVDGDVFISNITQIPIKYNEVSGSFVCSGLYNLKGLPKYVKGDMVLVGDCILMSLNYLPKMVNGKASVLYPHILLPKNANNYDIITIPINYDRSHDDYFKYWNVVFTVTENIVEEMAYLASVGINNPILEERRVELLHSLFSGETASKLLITVANDMGLDIGLSEDVLSIMKEALKANHRM